MNLQFYLEKLHSSEKFKEFKGKNPKAYFCSGFFIIDNENKKNQSNLDYFNPENKNITSFSLNEEIQEKPVENQDNLWVPKKLSESTNFDFGDIEKLISEKMENEKIKNKLQKILISLQKLDEGNSLLCTVFISMLGMLKIKINLNNMEIIEFEKKSLMDILKIRKKENVK